MMVHNVCCDQIGKNNEKNFKSYLNRFSKNKHKEDQRQKWIAAVNRSKYQDFVEKCSIFF